MIILQGQFHTKDGEEGCFFEIRKGESRKRIFLCRLYSHFQPDTNIGLTINDIKWEEMVKIHEMLDEKEFNTSFEVFQWLQDISDY